MSFYPIQKEVTAFINSLSSAPAPLADTFVYTLPTPTYPLITLDFVLNAVYPDADADAVDHKDRLSILLKSEKAITADDDVALLRVFKQKMHKTESHELTN